MTQRIAVAMQVWNEEDIIALSIRQLYEWPIDVFVLYDGGCTDNTIEIAKKYMRNLKCKTYIKQLEDPHSEYFLRHSLEPQTFNQWHEDLKDFDWILHLDADEIYSPLFPKFLYELKESTPEYNCIYFQRLQMIGSPSTYLWKCFENDPPCPVKGNDYHPLRHDFQNRFYKIKDFFYPDFDNMDTHPHPYHGLVPIVFNNVKILHIKYLLNKVKLLRGQTNYEASSHYTDPRNEYKELERYMIPDVLYEWWHSYTYI